MPPKKKQSNIKVFNSNRSQGNNDIIYEDDTNNELTNENESLNQEEASIINNDTSIPAPPNPSSVNQTALRSEVSNLDAVDKSSQNASIHNEEEDNNMDIDEN